MELSDIVKKTRESMGLSQAKFAALIGSNQTEVSFIERGFLPTNSDKVTKIFELYNIERKKNNGKL